MSRATLDLDDFRLGNPCQHGYSELDDLSLYRTGNSHRPSSTLISLDSSFGAPKFAKSTSGLRFHLFLSSLPHDTFVTMKTFKLTLSALRRNSKEKAATVSAALCPGLTASPLTRSLMVGTLLTGRAHDASRVSKASSCFLVERRKRSDRGPVKLPRPLLARRRLLLLVDTQYNL